MGADFIEFDIEKVGSSAKYSVAYSWFWTTLKTTISQPYFDIEDDVLKDYLIEISGKNQQQEFLGKRPYNKNSFVFAFPDYAGQLRCVAERAKHWFELSLSLWYPLLTKRLERCGVRLIDTGSSLSNLPNLSHLAKLTFSNKFIELRGQIWSLSDWLSFGELVSQSNRLELLSKTELSTEEVQQVERVFDSHCHCPLCKRLYLIEDAKEKFYSFLQKPLSDISIYTCQSMYVWISGLQQLTPENAEHILQALFKFSDFRWGYSGENSLIGTFYYFGHYAPEGTTLFGKHATDDPIQQVARIAELHGRYNADKVDAVEVWDVAQVALEKSTVEIMLALKILQDCPPSKNLELWNERLITIYATYKDFNRTKDDDPYHVCRGLSFHVIMLWSKIYPDKLAPENIIEIVKQAYENSKYRRDDLVAILTIWQVDNLSEKLVDPIRISG